MPAPTISARIYLADLHGVDHRMAHQVSSALEAAECRCTIVEVVPGSAWWLRSGLRSVPAVELLLGDQPMRSWAGKLDPELIALAVGELRQAAMPRRRVARHRVIQATGCHRYGRWNEQALASSDPHAGWSSISCSDGRSEMLTFDLFSQWSLCALALTPRDAAQNPDYRQSFPRDFHLLVSCDLEDWAPVLTVSGYQLDEQAVPFWSWDSVCARYVRLIFAATRPRPEAKYFCQIMQVEFWHDSAAVPLSLSPAVDLPYLPAARGDAQPHKRGLMWSPHHAVEQWTFAAAQTLPPRRLFATDVLLVMISGQLRLSWWPAADQEIPRELQGGATALIPAGTTFALAASATGPAVCMMVADGDGAEVWGTRA